MTPNAIGLVLNIIGIILMSVFGVAPLVKPETFNLLIESTPEEEKRNKKIIMVNMILGYTGLFFVIIGTILQAVSK